LPQRHRLSKKSEQGGEDKLITLGGMYEDYFLDYASYVILERAIPLIEDGLKPVQRRMLHALKTMDDGRFNKVANVIGQTMQYHPHGDAAIGDAMVKLGQKNLLLDAQGNWGDVRTGDRAAAPRYIETRLSKFALDVAFNNQTTEWQITYDGRKKEPIALPVKFPLLLAQGVDGIAVGLSTKILPHNFIELIEASIKHLKDKPFKLIPDFETGGIIDASDYNTGKRGGKVLVRTPIEIVDKNTLVISELPYAVTTTNLIDSVLKANEKGKIKIKKIVDNTAKDVSIQITLPSGVSPQVTIDALYAFTNCQVSISPNACVVVDNKPEFLSVNDILRLSTDRTKGLLKQELEIRKSELEEKWHFSSLEKIFIENRIYRDIEECETWEAVIKAIDKGLKPHVKHLKRKVTEEDITRLTEIKIKRISKYNKFKADEQITKLEEELKEVKHNLKNLTDYAIAYFERLLEKYGKGRERKTKIEQTKFETIKATQVIANNCKLYINRKDGFIGHGIKKEEFVCECSELADIIAFRKDGKMVVNRIGDKVFMGKNILHADVWTKGDDRTVYHMVYTDGKSGKTYVKRFHVKSVTRAKEYDLSAGNPNSRVHYIAAHKNGESEVVTIYLRQGSKARKKIFDFDFSTIAIKGKGSKGNTITKYPMNKVVQSEVGKSTLGAQKLWIDMASAKLNKADRGTYLGEFDTGDQLVSLFKNGSYRLDNFGLSIRYIADQLIEVGKQTPETVISAIYFDGEKKGTYVKRFSVETQTLEQDFIFISEATSSKLYFATAKSGVIVTCHFKKGKSMKTVDVDLDAFIDVKGWKSLGNKLMESKVIKVTIKEKGEAMVEPETTEPEATDKSKSKGEDDDNSLKPGDTVELFPND